MTMSSADKRGEWKTRPRATQAEPETVLEPATFNYARSSVDKATSLEDAVQYCQRPQRRVSLNVLMNWTRMAEINSEKWSKRAEACRVELTQRRGEIVNQLDNLQAILGEIDRHTDSRLR